MDIIITLLDDIHSSTESAEPETISPLIFSEEDIAICKFPYIIIIISFGTYSLAFSNSFQ